MADRAYLTQTELMILLAIMRLKDEAYGVPISAEILERLEDRGFVKSQLGEATAMRGGRAKTYFRVTAKGSAQVRETQHALQELWRGLPLKGKGP